MIKILFICHGNICRSTMAESVMKHLVREAGAADRFEIDSAATSTDAIGCPVHRGTRRVLEKQGIEVSEHYARQMKKSDYRSFDYIIGMDEANRRNIQRIVGEDAESKVYLLLDFVREKGEIADPWYTGDFDRTFEDVLRGCKALLGVLL